VWVTGCMVRFVRYCLIDRSGMVGIHIYSCFGEWVVRVFYCIRVLNLLNSGVEGVILLVGRVD